MRYISVCSGIEAATVAWHDLGWTPVAFAEVETFPSAVLKHHWPHVPNLGDMTKIDGSQYRGQVDILVGGTPCQAFSIAGHRQGLSDARGNLSLAFVELADAIQPSFVLWENVPGVLSSRDNAFGCFLAALAGEDEALVPAGEKWTDAGCVFGPSRNVAWRVLNAQHFGSAQRRRRVFVVACPRWGGADPCEVLFERTGDIRDPAMCREVRETSARTDTSGTRSSVIRLRHGKPGGGKGPLISEELSLTLATGNDQTVFVEGDGFCHARKLLPVEFERLQGFPDGHTDIPKAKDSTRYKALGNSICVNVMRWIGERIQKVEDEYARP